MAAIYTPAGKAAEYSPLACNLYAGCSHRCTYCYAPAILKRTREDFCAKPEPRKGILEALAKDATRLAGDPRPVLLSFTSDCYQPCEAVFGVTRRAIEIMGAKGLKIRVLTKNPGLAVERDMDILKKYHVHLGTTLTHWNATDAARWEPGAPEPEARWLALSKAKDNGITTWVSLEPVIDPIQTLDLLPRLGTVADAVKIGIWNYDKRAQAIDWTAFLEKALAICAQNASRYYWYIKDDLWARASMRTRERYPKSTLPAEAGQSVKTQTETWLF